jgi:hypothetical protein
VLFCVDEECDNSYSLGYPELDDEGRFNLAFAANTTGWIQVSYSADDPWVTASLPVTKKINVKQRAEFTTFAAGRENPDQVRISGHLAFLSGISPIEMPIDIQFSRNGVDGWHTVRTVDIGHNPTHPEGHFFSELVDRNRSGYWRVVYHGGEIFQSDQTESARVD